MLSTKLRLFPDHRAERAGAYRHDFDVVADGVAAGRILKVHAAPWIWTLAFGHHEDRTPTHGYEPTREAAMAAFAKSWGE